MQQDTEDLESITNLEIVATKDHNIIATLPNLNTKYQQENDALQSKLVAALEKLTENSAEGK